MSTTPLQPSTPSPAVDRLINRSWAPVARNVLFVVGFLLIAIGAALDVTHFFEGRGAEEALVASPQSPAGISAPRTIQAAEQDPTPAASLPSTIAPPAFFDPVFNSYIVARGDVLYDIASRHGTTTDVLIELNAIEDPNLIEVGQVIALPEPALDP